MHARVAAATIACCAAGVSIYLTLYQWDARDTVWDPLFGAASSKAVLDSVVSRALPVPDATLGAAAYLAEAVLALVGGRWRWQTSPWLVMAYGLLAFGMAAVSVGLILVQAFVVEHWCTLCLLSAAASFANAGLASHEFIAAIEHRLPPLATLLGGTERN